VVSEFIFSEQFYSDYKATKKMDALDQLVATLYRPAKKGYDAKRNPDGDIRIPYNDFLTGYYADKIGGWPAKVKQAILHWYEGCRLKLIDDNPDVFGASSGGGDSLYGLYSVMRTVAEKGIHGDLEKVERMYVKVFLMEINEQLAEAARIKAAHKTT
jgi:hypothetical protein